MSLAIGISTKVTFLSVINPNNNYIICANHKSYLDIVLMYLVIDQDFAFLGKSELLKWPVINIFFKKREDNPGARESKSRTSKKKTYRKKGGSKTERRKKKHKNTRRR